MSASSPVRKQEAKPRLRKMGAAWICESSRNVWRTAYYGRTPQAAYAFYREREL